MFAQKRRRKITQCARRTEIPTEDGASTRPCHANCLRTTSATCVRGSRFAPSAAAPTIWELVGVRARHEGDLGVARQNLGRFCPNPRGHLVVSWITMRQVVLFSQLAQQMSANSPKVGRIMLWVRLMRESERGMHRASMVHILGSFGASPWMTPSKSRKLEMLLERLK